MASSCLSYCHVTIEESALLYVRLAQPPPLITLLVGKGRIVSSFKSYEIQRDFSFESSRTSLGVRRTIDAKLIPGWIGRATLTSFIEFEIFGRATSDRVLACRA